MTYSLYSKAMSLTENETVRTASTVLRDNNYCSSASGTYHWAFDYKQKKENTPEVQLAFAAITDVLGIKCLDTKGNELYDPASIERNFKLAVAELLGKRTSFNNEQVKGLVETIDNGKELALPSMVETTTLAEFPPFCGTKVLKLPYLANQNELELLALKRIADISNSSHDCFRELNNAALTNRTFAIAKARVERANITETLAVGAPYDLEFLLENQPTNYGPIISASMGRLSKSSFTKKQLELIRKDQRNKRVILDAIIDAGALQGISQLSFDSTTGKALTVNELNKKLKSVDSPSKRLLVATCRLIHLRKNIYAL